MDNTTQATDRPFIEKPVLTRDETFKAEGLSAFVFARGYNRGVLVTDAPEGTDPWDHTVLTDMAAMYWIERRAQVEGLPQELIRLVPKGRESEVWVIPTKRRAIRKVTVVHPEGASPTLWLRLLARKLQAEPMVLFLQ